MNNQSYRSWTVLVVVALMALAFMAGMGAQNGSVYGLAAHIAQWVPGLYEARPDGTIPAATDLSPLATFWEVHNKINNLFVYPIEDQNKLTQGAIRGMVAALDDPYSRFLTPKDFEDFNEQTSGSFEGIGAWMEQEKAQGDKPARTVIMSVIPEGPAAKGGVHPGDEVVGVDGKATKDLNLSQVVDLIKGKAGTFVTLLLRRAGATEPLELKIVRAKVDVPNVETKVLPGNLGYLWLRTFNKQADREAREGLQKLLSQNVRGIVFDLSINGGGLLDQAIGVGSLFFKDGPIVFVRERGGQPKAENATPGALVPESLPLLVLIDGGTASASEIVAGALQDRGRAKLIGQHSFGKSKVQTVLQLNDNSALILTTAIYLTPKQRDIGQPWTDDTSKRGLRPDYPLPPPPANSTMTYDAWHQDQVRLAGEALLKEIEARAEAPAPAP